MSWRAAILLILIGIVAYFASMEPRADRPWEEEFSHTTRAMANGDAVRLTDVRDWTYDADGPVSRDWREVTVRADAVSRVWFVTVPFSAWKAVGHTFLTFEFKDGTALSFSVEARREVGEEYSSLLGLVNAYELSYVWGTERDLIAKRLVYLKSPVRRYPLSITGAMAKELFLGAIASTNRLADKPRFYNTLTGNCTNTLARIVNGVRPGTLPYSYAWNLPGYADYYLMRQGFIAYAGTKEETREAYDLTPHREAIAAKASESPAAFTAYLDQFAP